MATDASQPTNGRKQARKRATQQDQIIDQPKEAPTDHISALHQMMQDMRRELDQANKEIKELQAKTNHLEAKMDRIEAKCDYLEEENKHIITKSDRLDKENSLNYPYNLLLENIC
jgi:chromosome segregation ATPase